LVLYGYFYTFKNIKGFKLKKKLLEFVNSIFKDQLNIKYCNLSKMVSYQNDKYLLLTTIEEIESAIEHLSLTEYEHNEIFDFIRMIEKDNEQ
jgi:hypothetical protein